MADKTECDQCDYEHPVQPRRFVWCCPKCGRDYSLEYVFYMRAKDSAAIQEILDNQVIRKAE